MEKARLGEVPVVDLKCATCDLASEVGQALKRFGFFYVSNHGIPQELLSSQLEQNRRLFDLPDQVKRSMAFNVTLDIGYTGGTGTSQALDPNAGIQAADTKEGFMLTNNAFMGAAALDPTNPRKFLPRHPHLDPKDPLAGATLHWPPGLPGYERVIRSYFASAYELNYRLNDLLFSSLGMDANERNRLGSAPFCVLKQLRYGPGRDALANGSSIGAGAHADRGSLTLLLTDDTPGLQVEMVGEWLPVPPRRGMFIVNAGDQIEALTNGHYRSAKHRVITTSPHPRYSTAFFTYFNYKEPLTPLHEHVNPQVQLSLLSQLACMFSPRRVPSFHRSPSGGRPWTRWRGSSTSCASPSVRMCRVPCPPPPPPPPSLPPMPRARSRLFVRRSSSAPSEEASREAPKGACSWALRRLVSIC
jgi:isopenicillin N synthase-like dioxygenase